MTATLSRCIGVLLVTAFAGVIEVLAEANGDCPAGRLLPVLDAAYHECANRYANGSCERFVATFKELTNRYDCRRAFDTDAVPAIWLAGNARLEDFVELLSKLSDRHSRTFGGAQFERARAEGRALFASDAFRGVLDGALAEQYLKRSVRMRE